ncbi:hypothetical protein DesLBE_0599 [Desulfitobacterium sp. LBE]|uniref:Uncharacterized protein n=1 Tax=Desulfitobacterium hafniense DP7 TaxID=537010 RepID=G9XMB4_DESHA|nr:hypothetical protein HMPREF0322_02100 [Desulfitobacterium hafniense DP7]TWH56396.1 hypothetical protein DesLBE_0599 [Desulfitobacterium sp. LBE]
MQSNRLCNFFTLPGNYNLDMKHKHPNIWPNHKLIRLILRRVFLNECANCN